MPTAPELCHIQRLIREIEVLFQLEAHHGSQTDTHIAVAGEVAVYLQGIAEDAHEVLETAVGRRVVEYPVVVLGDVVGDEGFLQQAHDDEPQAAIHQFLVFAGFCFQLRYQDLSPCDGACHEEREERQIETVFQQTRLHRELPLIDINAVADGLERVERDADGQEDIQQGEVAGKNIVEGGQQEVGVLVI